MLGMGLFFLILGLLVAYLLHLQSSARRGWMAACGVNVRAPLNSLPISERVVRAALTALFNNGAGSRYTWDEMHAYVRGIRAFVASLPVDQQVVYYEDMLAQQEWQRLERIQTAAMVVTAYESARTADIVSNIQRRLDSQ